MSEPTLLTSAWEAFVAQFEKDAADLLAHVDARVESGLAEFHGTPGRPSYFKYHPKTAKLLAKVAGYPPTKQGYLDAAKADKLVSSTEMLKLQYKEHDVLRPKLEAEKDKLIQAIDAKSKEIETGWSLAYKNETQWNSAKLKSHYDKQKKLQTERTQLYQRLDDVNRDLEKLDRTKPIQRPFVPPPLSAKKRLIAAKFGAALEYVQTPKMEELVTASVAELQPKASQRDSRTALKVLKKGGEVHVDIAVNYNRKPGLGEQLSEPDVACKHNLVTQLSKKTGVTYDKTNAIIHTWALSSNDNNPLSAMVQREAASMFGTRLSEWQAKTLPKTGATVKFTHIDNQGKQKTLVLSREEIRLTIAAMYAHTQETFKSLGIKELVLHRGSGMSESVIRELFPHGKFKANVTVGMNALSSWTAEYQTATHFSDEGIPVRFTAKVPVSRILSSPLTGFGCKGEYEFVVVGRSRGDRMYARFAANKVPDVWDDMMYNSKTGGFKPKPKVKKSLKTVQPAKKPKTLKDYLNDNGADLPDWITSGATVGTPKKPYQYPKLTKLKYKKPALTNKGKVTIGTPLPKKKPGNTPWWYHPTVPVNQLSLGLELKDDDWTY
jgi:hypothetical protein